VSRIGDERKTGVLVAIRNGPVLCFLALTGISIRGVVSIRNAVASDSSRALPSFVRAGRASKWRVTRRALKRKERVPESWRLIFGRGLCFERLTRDSIKSGWRLILQRRATDPLELYRLELVPIVCFL
jgi:hypothetical protein